MIDRLVQEEFDRVLMGRETVDSGEERKKLIISLRR